MGRLLVGQINTGSNYTNVVVSALVGGTISKLTGGKFSNGAQTWAFQSAVAQDWEAKKETINENELNREPSKRTISDSVDKSSDLDLTVSEDGKTLSGDISVYCSGVSDAACKGLIKSLSQINQITDGLTLDLNFEVTSWSIFADVKVSWRNMGKGG